MLQQKDENIQNLYCYLRIELQKLIGYIYNQLYLKSADDFSFRYIYLPEIYFLNYI